MNFKRFVVVSATAFTVTLIVSVGVTLLWNAVGHGVSTVDWETSFRTAIVFGILMPWIAIRRESEK